MPSWALYTRHTSQEWEMPARVSQLLVNKKRPIWDVLAQLGPGWHQESVVENQILISRYLPFPSNPPISILIISVQTLPMHRFGDRVSMSLFSTGQQPPPTGVSGNTESHLTMQGYWCPLTRGGLCRWRSWCFQAQKAPGPWRWPVRKLAQGIRRGLKTRNRCGL